MCSKGLYQLMILLCPLIHPPIDAGVSDYTLMRSSLPFCESVYGWFHLVMRDAVKVKRVCEHSCVCVWKSRADMCVYMCVHCAVVWLGEMGVVWSAGLFVFVISYSLPRLLLMACLWDTDIKLSDRLSSAFEVSWAVHPGLSTTGDQPSMAAVWGSLISHVL